MNKRGISQIWDVVIAAILFMIFFGIVTLIVSSGALAVHTRVDAANTRQLCYNNLNAIMKFSSENIEIKEVLANEYYDDTTRQDYPKSEEEIRRIFDNYSPGKSKWEITLLQEEILASFGEIEEQYFDDSKTCSYFLPLACKNIDRCVMEVRLRLAQ